MATPAKPVVLVVPGAWHSPSHFTPLVRHLQRAGFPCEAINLSPEETFPETQTFAAHVQIIRESVEGSVHEGRECMLVLHSYGGVVGCEATRGLSKTERAARGETGGVVALLFLSAFIFPEGGSPLAARGSVFPPHFSVEVGTLDVLLSFM